MCGIAGYFGQGDEEVLHRMIKSIEYRGPDDSGIFCYENIGLAQARLAILDLSPEGHQPMSDENQNIWLVFNGEIYNFPELKNELEADGQKFKSASDTEVIIYLYKKYGLECFQKMNGMFALAIFDKKNNKFILARDRFGKKPLYYSIINNTLIFASELKALQNHPLSKKEIDLESLNQYLQFEYVPTPRTILKNVYKLEPATYLVFDGKNILKNYFWQPNFSKEIISEKEALEKFSGKLETAVKKRLISDVPLGILLSGGLDSSAIAYYAQKNSPKKILTFSIGFNEKSFDESSYARLVAKHLETDHHEKIFTGQDCLSIIPEIFSRLDEPLADASIIPSFLLSKFAREKITVALGGDGGDELLCGYDTFLAEYFSPIYEKSPNLLKKILKNFRKFLPTSFANISHDFKIKKFLDGYDGQSDYRHLRWLGAFSRDERSQLFRPEIWQKLEKLNEFASVEYYLSKIKYNDKWDKLIHLYLRSYLMDDILVKMDRASMYNSLEVRSPFLDFELADFVNSLSNNFKIRKAQTKYLLRKCLVGKIPEKIIKRRKKGFGIPLALWLQNELRPLLEQKFAREKIIAEGFFNPDYIEKLLADHFAQRADNRKQIWTLLVFESWLENFYKQ